MVAYKLYYTDVRARAEVSRLIFAYAGVEYEDVRLPWDEWLKMKPTTPFGNIPVLEVDGRQIPQSHAIARYLAKQFGLAGKTAFDEAWVNAIADQFKDYHEEAITFFINVGGFKQFFYKAPELTDQEKVEIKKLSETARDKFFPMIEKILAKNKSGFLVGNDLTWVDLLVSEHVATINEHLPEHLEKFPLVLAHSEKIRTIPQIKQWIEKRPRCIL